MRVGVGRIQRGVIGCTNPTQWRCGDLLPIVYTLSGGGASASRSERCHIPSGDGGGRCWIIVGCYLTLYNALFIECIFGAMAQVPCEAALMVVGYLNSNTVDPERNRIDEAIEAALSDAGLEVISGHFLMCRT